MSTVIKSSILAGFIISIAGFGYLAIGGVVGAVLFSFGLITIVSYKLKLYTGTAGFIKRRELPNLLMILVGNIIGCLLGALMTRTSNMDLQTVAQNILETRLESGPIKCGILAIGCGIIMTTAVKFSREKNYLPLLFGVPLFIVCGFTHCIADAFYYCSVPFSFIKENFTNVLVIYISIVIGNFIGCNLVRFFGLDN
jgi:formate/nitrite transporter FocA (FNT family)